MSKKPKTTGDVLLELEPLLFKLVEQGLQHGDIMALVHVWLTTHAPGAIETYTEGGHPVFYYGHASKRN